MKQLACLNFKSDMSWGYIEGYRRAAALVAQQMLDGIDLDYLVYPLGYLYRHHVELQLKFLLDRSGTLLDEVEPPAKGHVLERLWRKLRSKLQQLQDSEEFLDEIEAGIAGLVSLDNSGQEFRYSRTNSEQTSLEKLTHLDIEKFHSNCELLCENLQAVHESLNVALETKKDYELLVIESELELQRELSSYQIDSERFYQ